MISRLEVNDELCADVCGAVEAAKLRDQANLGSRRRSTLSGGFRGRRFGGIRSRRAGAKTGKTTTTAPRGARTGANSIANTILL